jgi:hypothetical protein
MTERRHPKPAEPDALEGVDGREGASPLGRGANPGVVPDASPLSDTHGSVAGLRGMDSPNARGGPEGFLDRENEDVKPAARRGATDGSRSSDADASRH